MFGALGIGGGGSLVGGVGALLAIIPFAFYRYGRKIRERSKFAPTDDKDNSQGDETDEVEKGAARAGDGVARAEPGDNQSRA
jgi:MFS transporter, DHA1 family, multidrug resistance protein